MIAKGYEPTIENESELKDRFAELWLRNPSSVYKAAHSLFPENPMVCGWICNTWAVDPQVIKRKEDLLSEYGPEHFLPTKEDASWEIWNRVTGDNVNHDEFEKLMKLYCSVRGYIEKGSTNIQNNTMIASPVMIMPAEVKQTDAQWEEQLIIEQRKLTDDSKVT